MSKVINECIPYREPGEAIVAKAEAAVFGKRFVSISGPAEDGAFEGLADNADGGRVLASHCPAGGRPDGVSSYDAAIDEGFYFLGSSGFVVPVKAGAAISAGDEVAVGANGQAVPAAVKASVVTGVVGNNNAIRWTAREEGLGGNDLSVTLVVAGNNTALTVDVDGDDVIVNVATDGGGLATSTATEVIAAVREHDTASQLVSVANEGASTGAGTVAAVAETPLAGASGATERAVAKAMDDASNGADCPVKLY